MSLFLVAGQSAGCLKEANLEQDKPEDALCLAMADRLADHMARSTWMQGKRT